MGFGAFIFYLLVGGFAIYAAYKRGLDAGHSEGTTAGYRLGYVNGADWGYLEGRNSVIDEIDSAQPTPDHNHQADLFGTVGELPTPLINRSGPHFRPRTRYDNPTSLSNTSDHGVKIDEAWTDDPTRDPTLPYYHAR